MARKIDLCTIDFETRGIQKRPAYPPEPVGVSIKYRGKSPRYFAWGHPTKNNATKAQAKSAVQDAYRSGLPINFMNGKFDVDVAEIHMGLKVPQWDRIHDVMFLLFLHDPHQRDQRLKPSAERLLGEKPEEQDAVRAWLEAQGVVRKRQKDWGAHISKAPGDLVGRYANGDTSRTEALLDLLLPQMDEGMLRAYDRERRLMPILLRNEREGMRVDLRALARDVKVYEAAKEKADAWLRKRLKAKDLNVDSDEELADALDSAGIVTEWATTATGRRSTAKKNMTRDLFKDPRVFAVLGYRNRLHTCLSTFMLPWLEIAEASGGIIYTDWNQVKQSDEGGNYGTRTGRMSCTPNFQNIPKDWYDKGDWTPEDFAAVRKLLGLPDLPQMRRYILADEGCAFGHRDYNQQEPRILGHFENDKLCAQYNADPLTDFHTFMQQAIRDITGIALERRPVKILNLGMMYGMGISELAKRLGVDMQQAKRLKAAQMDAIPGIAELDKEVKHRGRSGQPVRTWGGRLYHCEPPVLVNKPGAWNHGRMQTFEYKLINYLIQGSAADCTKEAIIRYDEHPKRRGRFQVTVHDECNISAAKRRIKEELLVLREAMESVEFDVPMVTDAKAGPNWGALTKVKEAR